MRLIGMLDSPFVRRVAVAMLMAEIPFEHEPLSIWRHADKFASLSPLQKAPSLIADDGAAIVDSGVILDYLSLSFPAMAALRPRGLPALRALGVALTVMEKAVQLYYEHNVRSAGERSESWTARVRGQLETGLAGLDAAVPELWFEDGPGHADIAAVCAFGFVRGALADRVDFAVYPRLAGFSGRAETLGPFRDAPPLDGVKIGPRKALA
jgi:glutathione S-transferase